MKVGDRVQVVEDEPEVYGLTGTIDRTFWEDGDQYFIVVYDDSDECGEFFEDELERSYAKHPN